MVRKSAVGRKECERFLHRLALGKKMVRKMSQEARVLLVSLAECMTCSMIRLSAGTLPQVCT